MCGVSDKELVQGVHSVECTRVQSTLTLSCTDHQLWCVHVIHVLLVDFHILCALLSVLVLVKV